MPPNLAVPYSKIIPLRIKIMKRVIIIHADIKTASELGVSPLQQAARYLIFSLSHRSYSQSVVASEINAASRIFYNNDSPCAWEVEMFPGDMPIQK